ncbi:hypothetical protein [Methylobacterium sp. 37f]|uniref:hypothetical protein n=1 Tax=Methylobacterium sp. 37f TaxID=2817058 RepID=UPI001FFD451E|nr:hypothetical protein [Methylobacterium sp. 37f]MCK2056030.1 hypothetical protein [Methylobacterium sp. 37f]
MTGRTLVILFSGAVLLALTILFAVPLLVLATAGPHRARPPLLRDLPAGFAQADAAFAARIADTFPLGSPESVLVQRLQAEGFGRDLMAADPSDERRMRFTVSESSCTLTWRVRWGVEVGRLATVAGKHDGRCL